MARSNRIRVKQVSKASVAVDPRYMVPGLSRGLKLLQLFQGRQAARTLADIARGLGLSRSAAFRLVYTLEQDGFLSRDKEGRLYRLTSKTLSLGFNYLDSRTIIDLAQPFLRQLSDRTSTAVHIAILDGWYAVYLSRVMPPVALVTNLQLGSRLPAHVTASGRVLISHLDDLEIRNIFATMKKECRVVSTPQSVEELLQQAHQDRRRGYVFHRSVFSSGVTSMAYPIRDKSGGATAAITMIGQHDAMQTLGGENAIKSWMSETAASISCRMGYTG